MIITDPIADMITRIKNAFTRKHKNVIIPHSKKKERILQIFLDEGYIKGFTVSGEVKKEINVELKYKGIQVQLLELKEFPSLL